MQTPGFLLYLRQIATGYLPFMNWRLSVLAFALLVPLSAFWIVADDYRWLAIVQVISGCAWAAYELGFFLMFFEMLPRAQRTRLLTLYNFANAAAICVVLRRRRQRT